LNVPPKVPYKASTFALVGTAYYHDFGAFLADLENSSPFIRLKSMSLESTSSGVEDPSTSDKLSFRVEFMTLIKPATDQK
jgi:hypothetical protein